jgi:hypothetical protein
LLYFGSISIDFKQSLTASLHILRRVYAAALKEVCTFHVT